MAESIENIFGNRLKLARKMAGMSLQDLSDALHSEVTKQSLNKYEMGLMKPTSEVLISLSKILKVKPDFFLKKNNVQFGEIAFRKKTTFPKKQEESIIEKTRHYIERYLEIENILHIENTFKNPLHDLPVNNNKKDVEIAANKLRDIWELGSNPISNIIEMLELRGIKVVLINEADDIDGFAVFTSTGIPVVLVNRYGKPKERIRFTIIHELAHLILQFEKNLSTKEVEVLCHCFASCFLIPSKMLIGMIGSAKRNYVSINELIAIKEYYGISIRALIHRLRELEVITPNYYQRWVIYLSKKYGAKDEPGEYLGEEKSKVFAQLINRALAEELISISKASVLSNTNINEFRKGFVSAINY